MDTTIYTAGTSIAPEQIAALRFKEAVRSAQAAIASREMRMRNWLAKHPSVRDFVDPPASVRTPIVKWTDRMVLFAAGVFTVGVNRQAQDASGKFDYRKSWRTHLVHMALSKDQYARIEPTLLKRPVRGAIAMSIIALYRFPRDTLVHMPLLLARLLDARDHRREWTLDRMKSKAWFDEHVRKIDAPFQTTTELVNLCARIVPQAAVVSSADGTAQNMLRTKQHDLWAVQLAKHITAVAAEIPAFKQLSYERKLTEIRAARNVAEAAATSNSPSTGPVTVEEAAAAATAANAAAVADEAAAKAAVSHIRADFQTCLTAALDRCPWADKIPSKMTLNKDIDGNFALMIEYKEKARFSREMSIDDIHLHGRSALIQDGEVARLQSLSARLEAKLENKVIYQRLANSDLFRPIIGEPAGATHASLQRHSLAPFSTQLTGIKALAAFCTKHLAGGPATVTAKILDRATAVSLDLSNMTNYLFRSRKNDLTDPLLTSGYRNLRKHVEAVYGTQIEARLIRQYPGISREALAANQGLCVARAISTALEDKIAFGAVPLSTLINGALQQMTVLRQPRPLEEMFVQPEVVLQPGPKAGSTTPAEMTPLVASAPAAEAISTKAQAPTEAKAASTTAVAEDSTDDWYMDVPSLPDNKNILDLDAARQKKETDGPKPPPTNSPHFF